MKKKCCPVKVFLYNVPIPVIIFNLKCIYINKSSVIRQRKSSLKQNQVAISLPVKILSFLLLESTLHYFREKFRFRMLWPSTAQRLRAYTSHVTPKQ